MQDQLNHSAGSKFSAYGEMLTKNGLKIRIVNFRNYAQYFKSLSFVDNILVGQTGKHIVRMLANKKMRQVLKVDFLEAFPEKEFPGNVPVGDLEDSDAVSLFLFHAIFCSPDIVVLERCPLADAEKMTMVNQMANYITEAGGAVCYIVTDIYDRLPLADRYVSVDDNAVNRLVILGDSTGSITQFALNEGE